MLPAKGIEIGVVKLKVISVPHTSLDSSNAKVVVLFNCESVEVYVNRVGRMTELVLWLARRYVGTLYLPKMNKIHSLST